MSNGDNLNTPPDPATTISNATGWYNLFTSWSQNQPGSPAFVSTAMAQFHAMKQIGIPSSLAQAAAGILGLIANITAGALGALEAVKSDPNAAPGINKLITAALSDLFGSNINITASDASGGPTVDPQATGQAIFSVMAGLFGGLDNPISPDQGAANAKSFLGFGANFAVVTAFLGFLGGLVPFLHLDEIKGFGEEMQRVLGLGRLTHTAVTPLVRNMIAQPFDLWLRAQLRPDRLAEAQLVRGLRAGLITEDVVRQGMAEKGYPDDAIDFLLTDFSVKLALSELYLLLLNGDVQEQDVINNLTLTGMPEDQAKLQLKAVDLASVKTQQTALLSWAESNYVDGFITQDQWNSILQNLMLGDLEETAIRTKVGWKQESPRKRVSFAEVKTAIVDNIVDFSYLDAWLAAEGYDQQSQLIMSFQVLEAIKSAENKVAFAKYKANALRVANKPVPPWITAAESTT